MIDRYKLKLTIAFLACAQITVSSYYKCEALNNAELQKAILQANVLDGENFTVMSSGSNAVVSTYLTGKDSEKNCRMKSVLLAKAIMDKAKEIAVVRVTFFNKTNQGNTLSLEVHVGDIHSYGSGATSLSALLASLPVSKTTGSSQGSAPAGGQSRATSSSTDSLPEVKGGINRQERQSNLDTLRMLKHGGLVDVSAAVAAFRQEQEYGEKGNYALWIDEHNKVLAMLNTLTDVHNERARTHEVKMSPLKPGACYSQRMTILALMQSKRAAGVDTSRYEAKFNAIEQLVESGGHDTIVQHAVDSLLRELR